MLIDPDWTELDNDSLFWAAEGGSEQAAEELRKRKVRAQIKARPDLIAARARRK